MPTLGQREEITYKAFSGVALQPGLYPEVLVPQDLVGPGLLLDARNMRFSQGRAYWHRNQLRVGMPGPASFSGVDCGMLTQVAGTNVVTVTTDAPHGLLVGEQVSLYSTAPDAWFNGLKAVAVVGSPTTFTYAAPGAVGSTTLGTVTPTRLVMAYEYVSDSASQLLCQLDDGTLRVKDAGWAAVPTVWGYGFQQFSSAAYSTAATGLPTYSIRAMANMRNRLLMVAGTGIGFSLGMPMKSWNGTTLSTVGLITPALLSTTAGTADATGTGNLLDDGTYSYRFTFANLTYESMMSDPVDCVVEASRASGYVDVTTLTSVIAHHDTLTLDGSRFRFVNETTMIAAGGKIEVGDVLIYTQDASAAVNLQLTMTRLASMAWKGTTVTSNGVTVYTPPLQNCDVYWSYVPNSRVRITLIAKDTGTAGNAIALQKSCAALTLSAATLSGGIGLCNIDLAGVPTGPTGTTKRNIYRAYTTITASGNRGTSYGYIGTISNNIAATFQDNVPAGDAGEPPAFDHAIPPVGDILTAHKDRLWMAGVCQTSISYTPARAIVGSPTGAVNTSNVTTITTTLPHGFSVGDVVVLAGITHNILNGTFTVATVPSTTTFTVPMELSYTQSPYSTSSGGGSASLAAFGGNLSNVLFYSQLDEPFYWPGGNQIAVGGSNPIVALVTWHDQLLILKSDSAWLLTGYGEDDWNLVQIPGIKGAIGGHAATSPYGVMFAGHNGWMLWDGQQARTVVDFQEASAPAGELPSISPPLDTDDTSLRAPAVCYHDERFHLWGSAGFIYSWHPEENAWEIARRNVSGRTGIRAFTSSVSQSHILALISWGPLAGTSNYLTMLDTLYRPSTGNYSDTSGTGNDGFYGEVNVELAPVVAPAGELVNPLEVWVNGQWTVPVDSADDLKLEIYRAGAWVAIGTVTANGRLGIPAGYAQGRIRLRLHGLKCPFLVLQSVRVIFQRRAARG